LSRWKSPLSADIRCGCFGTPNSDGLPDFPWHEVDDLHRCLGLTRAERKHFLHLQAHKEALRIVATADGIVTIAPHFIAQGTIDASRPGARQHLLRIRTCRHRSDAEAPRASSVSEPVHGWHG